MWRDVKPDSPISIYEFRIDIYILADSGLILPSPPTRSLSTGIVKSAGEMMHCFETYQGGDFLKRVVGKLDELLGPLDTVLQ